MRPAPVVELDVGCQTDLGARHLRFEVHLFVFDGVREPFNENIASPATLPYMLIRILFSLSTPLNSGLMNW